MFYGSLKSEVFILCSRNTKKSEITEYISWPSQIVAVICQIRYLAKARYIGLPPSFVIPRYLKYRYSCISSPQLTKIESTNASASSELWTELARLFKLEARQKEAGRCCRIYRTIRCVQIISAEPFFSPVTSAAAAVDPAHLQRTTADDKVGPKIVQLIISATFIMTTTRHYISIRLPRMGNG